MFTLPLRTGRLRSSLLAAVVLAAGAPGAGAGPDALSGLRGRARVLLVSAPAPDDPGLRRQRAIYDAMGTGARERDLKLVEAVGDDAEARRLRAAFGIDGSRFAAVLIGKDGGAKLRSAEPLGPDRLFPTIDAMPMRRDEMERTKR